MNSTEEQLTTATDPADREADARDQQAGREESSAGEEALHTLAVKVGDLATAEVVDSGRADQRPEFGTMAVRVGDLAETREDTEAATETKVAEAVDPASPQSASPQQAVPQQAAPQQAVPQQAVPQQAVPQQAAPQQAVPQQAVPQQAAPQQAVPQQAVPQQAVPQQAVPQQAVPQQAAPSAWSGPPPVDPLSEAMEVMARLRARVRSQVMGRDEVIDLVLVALLADGHVLLEDFPGSGKTTLAKTLGGSIVAEDPREKIADFRRVQFTPDLLPSDVTGVSVFDAASSEFHFRPGPIFAHVLLADEINRTSPKVQSAMLEAMAEKQVTVDNVTHQLDELFFVIATQNPLDLAGTYPLPVAQLDRFLFKIRMKHIDRAAELEVLDTYRKRRDTDRVDLPRVTRSQVIKARRAIDEFVAIEQDIKECLVDIAQAVRDDDRVLQGNSTRSLVLLLPALQAHAVLQGRDYVSSDDIKALIPRVLGHRVELAPGVGNLEQVLSETMERPFETLARSTLRPRRGGIT